MSKILIKQVKSVIKTSKKQKLTLQALGLRKLNKVAEHQSYPEILGMIKVVKHLVKVYNKK